MRLFFIEWTNAIPELVVVVKDIKKRGHEIVYWSGTNLDSVNKSDFPGTIFHNYNDALAGKPAVGVDDSKFLPPSESLIKKLYETESIMLSMMNKKYSYFSTDERKRFYYRLLRYWYGIITELKPEAIIFSVVPHTVYNFLIYSLAKLFNIKTIMFDYTLVSDRVRIQTDYINNNLSIQEAIRANQKNYSLDDLSPDIQEHYRRQSNSNSSPPQYFINWIASYTGFNGFKRKLKSILSGIRSLEILKIQLLGAVRKLSGPNMKKEYENLQVEPHLDDKFIYAPLHYQPECSTCPMGGVFNDQILMLETLSASLPNGWSIYVKEHPAQWVLTGKGFTIHRFKNYYKQIADLKNVKLVSVRIPSSYLIQKAQAVATITGAAGSEAILHSKPCLLFGNIWYQDCEGVFNVNDVSSCRQALLKIEKGFKIDQQKVINYLYYLDKFSFHGYDHVSTKKLSKITPQENHDNFLAALISEIEKR